VVPPVAPDMHVLMRALIAIAGLLAHQTVQDLHTVCRLSVAVTIVGVMVVEDRV
jgi:hypothetical protein